MCSSDMSELRHEDQVRNIECGSDCRIWFLIASAAPMTQPSSCTATFFSSDLALIPFKFPVLYSTFIISRKGVNWKDIEQTTGYAD